jgi:hypothetical protein
MNWSIMMDLTNGAGTAYSSGAHRFTSGGVRPLFVSAHSDLSTIVVFGYYVEINFNLFIFDQ